ncbi:hypothetical protein F5B19DRAFT_496041 [Rostrohypoxylon terebratum]|nr:hypothetical protein F5B19DRAFT_496041 [Rostrohypoxylon terebratum]
MNMRQERLLAILQKTCGNSEEDSDFTFSHNSVNRFRPRLDVFSSATLQKYMRITLHPDPVRLCDMFLARYNLPHILTGSYDPIELMHMHGWEQDDYGDIVLVIQQSTDIDSPGVEVPWKHIDQTGEPLLALRLAQVTPLIKDSWLYQGRSIRNQDELDVPFETDEFADSVLFLNCPGYTKALLYQSSYDSSGAHFSREPWLSGKHSLLCQLQSVDDRLRVEPSCPWDGKVFGRLWQIFHHRRLLSFACMYLILSQMSIVGDTSQTILATKKAIRFVSCYASKWPRFMQTSRVWMSPNWIHLHFHLRVLSVGKQCLPSNYQYQLKNGLRPARFSGKLTSLSGMDDIGIIEERFSIAVVASITGDMPSYTIIYLSDSGYRRLFMESERPLDMSSRGNFTGVAAYLKVLLYVLPVWKRKWIETLNEFDNLVGVKIDDLFDPKLDGAAMFDSTFERSKLYFTVLQTLRIFTEWIQESEREVQQLKRDFDVNIQSNASRHSSIASTHITAPRTIFMKEIDEAWDELINMHGSSSKYLLDRIEKKEAEIKSFRDGLFSATSVREASRATALNQYILVFTIVTIFYLPLSYVSSLFSMDIFDYDSIRSSQTTFITITILIAVSTWAISAAVLWLVADDRRLSRFKLLFGSFRWKAIFPRRRRAFEDETLEFNRPVRRVALTHTPRNT